MRPDNCEQSLEQLALHAQHGNRSAFRSLVERTQASTYALAFRLLADDSEARDAAQEAYIRVWNHLHSYDPSQRFLTWMYRITLNASLDRWRAQRRRRILFLRPADEDIDALQDCPDPNATMTNADLGRRIRTLTQELPKMQRTVFILRDLQDLSTEETAEVLRISINSVKVNLHHARSRIRAILRERFGITREDV